MTPVIRIPDALFRRLQKHGEPLVDSPASVIARVLDAFEGKNEEDEAMAADELPPAEPGQPTRPKLFLTPASGENLRATIQQTVPLAAAAQHLTEPQTAALKEALGGERDFHCWAMTEKRKTFFAAMAPGDIVLLTEKGTGKFTWFGVVVAKVVSEALGKALWDEVPGLPWKLIYVLSDVRHIAADKDKLVSELGFKKGYWVPGVLQVRPRKFADALERHGTIDGLLRACSE